MERNKAELGIQGDLGYATTAGDSSNGEADFARVVESGEGLARDQARAAESAFQQLKKRLGRPHLGWWYGESHPWGR